MGNCLKKFCKTLMFMKNISDFFTKMFLILGEAAKTAIDGKV